MYLVALCLAYALRILQDTIANGKPPARIIYFYDPDNSSGQEYARFYVQALETVGLLRKVSSRHRCPATIKALLDSSKSSHVGLFVITGVGGDQLKIAIDAHDSPPVTNASIYGWCDIYFKSNYWPSQDYGRKVRPIINGNGLLDHLRLRHIARLRGLKKDFDISCIMRIWAGPSFDPDHCLDLLCRISELSCRKYLLAIFCGFKENDQFLRRYIRICRSNSIPYSLEPIDYNEMIGIAARSRAVVLRNGVSSCIPWRFLDMLCLGACVVFDHDPVVRWPDPLIRNQHYLSLDLYPLALRQRTKGNEVFTEAASARDVKEKLETYLERDDLLEDVRCNAINYYLSSCAPRKLGGYVFSTAVAG